jgi:hypothetical protein
MAFIDDFKARFPEIATATVDIYFPINENTYQCYFNAAYAGDGNCNDEAILLLMAHLVTIDSSKGSSSKKDATAKSVDGVSVSFATPAAANQNDMFFMSTKYGQRYLQIRAFSFGGVFV